MPQVTTPSRVSACASDQGEHPMRACDREVLRIEGRAVPVVTAYTVVPLTIFMMAAQRNRRIGVTFGSLR